MCDFTTIERGEKYITIQHDETGLVVAYTSEERLKAKTLNINDYELNKRKRLQRMPAR